MLIRTVQFVGGRLVYISLNKTMRFYCGQPYCDVKKTVVRRMSQVGENGIMNLKSVNMPRWFNFVCAWSFNGKKYGKLSLS